MTSTICVRATPGFAGGSLRDFNRLLLACARAGSPAGVTLQLTGAGETEPLLRVQNAHGDPVGLPGPLHGVFPDARARAFFAAAVRDAVPPIAGLAGIVDDFLPAVGAAPPAAQRALLPRLLPGLRVEIVDAPADGRTPGAATAATAAAESETPRIVWVGERLRRACADLGISVEELLAPERAASEKYRPTLAGDLGAALEGAEAAWSAELNRLRALAEEVDPGLLGAWARLDRGLRRSLGDFRAAAERCLDNHAGIRRTRWHHLYQALRPAGAPQEEGYSLLHLALALGMRGPISPEILGRIAERTSPRASDRPPFLLLDP